MDPIVIPIVFTVVLPTAAAADNALALVIAVVLPVKQI